MTLINFSDMLKRFLSTIWKIDLIKIDFTIKIEIRIKIKIKLII